MKHNQIWGLHASPNKLTSMLLGAVPFVIIVAAYWIASDLRLAENSADKLLPSFGKMYDSMMRMAFEPNVRSGELLLWKDTIASLTRLGVGTICGALVGLVLGVNMGLYPGLRAATRPFVTALSLVPPLTLLPILFITFGVEEAAKMILIFIGTVFVITRDMYIATSAISIEIKTKALTLGASSLGLTYRVVTPLVLPRLIDTTRLALGAAWLFLIAAEAVASSEGLGYRIFLVRRYNEMSVIIPYVIWITLLGFSIDTALRLWREKGFRWYSNNS